MSIANLSRAFVWITLESLSSIGISELFHGPMLVKHCIILCRREISIPFILLANGWRIVRLQFAPRFGRGERGQSRFALPHAFGVCWQTLRKIEPTKSAAVHPFVLQRDCLMRTFCWFRNGYDHADSLLVVLVVRPQINDQILFFKVKSDEDIQRHRQRQHQIGHRHGCGEPDAN